MFRNNNPDKGTETELTLSRKQVSGCLEIITPIRGRKLSLPTGSLLSLVFRNNNPDKGTETNSKF